MVVLPGKRIAIFVILFFAYAALWAPESRPDNDKNLAQQSIFRPLNNLEIRDMGFIKYLVVSTLRTTPEPAIDVFSNIYDRPVKLSFSRPDVLAPNSVIIPCDVGGKVYYTHILTNAEGDREITVYTQDEYVAAGVSPNLVRPEQPRIELYYFHETYRDEVLRLKHADGQVQMLSITDNSVQEVLSFLNKCGAAELAADFSSFISAGNVFVVNGVDFAHASKRAIHIGLDMDDRALALVHEVFAKTGQPDSINRRFTEAFKVYRGSPAMFSIYEFDSALSNILPHLDFNADLDAAEDRDYSSDYDLFAAERDYEAYRRMVPDHRLVNALIRVASESGLSRGEGEIVFNPQQTVTCMSFGPAVQEYSEDTDNWLINALCWVARENDMVRPVTLRGTGKAESEDIEVFRIDLKGAGNFGEFFMKLPKLHKDEVKRTFDTVCISSGVRDPKELSRMFVISMQRLSRRPSYSMISRSELYYFGDGQDGERIAVREMEHLTAYRNTLALISGYPSWTKMPEEYKVDACMVPVETLAMENFADLYKKFNQDMRTRVEQAFFDACLADGISRHDARLLFEISLPKLQNIAGHAGVRSSRIYTINGGNAASHVTMIRHEVDELLSVQEWIAARAGYEHWCDIPLPFLDKIVTNARYGIKQAAPVSIPRFVSPEYAVFLSQAHRLAGMAYPIKGQRVYLAPENEAMPEILKRAYSPPIAAKARAISYPGVVWRLLTTYTKDVTPEEVSEKLGIQQTLALKQMELLRDCGLASVTGTNDIGSKLYRAGVVLSDSAGSIAGILNAEELADGTPEAEALAKSEVLKVTALQRCLALAEEVSRASAYASEKNEPIIIAVELSWVPEAQRSSIEALLSKFNQSARKRGVNNVVLVKGAGDQFERGLRDAAAATGTQPKNILIIGDQRTVVDSGRFNDLRLGGNGAFVAGIDTRDIKDTSYIRILEIITIASRYAFSDKPVLGRHDAMSIAEAGAKTIFIVPLPEAIPMSIEQVNAIYRSELRAMVAA